MSSKFWCLYNFGAGILNLGIYFISSNPKWYTVVIASISFFCAGYLFGEDD